MCRSWQSSPLLILHHHPELCDADEAAFPGEGGPGAAVPSVTHLRHTSNDNSTGCFQHQVLRVWFSLAFKQDTCDKRIASGFCTLVNKLFQVWLIRDHVKMTFRP